MFVSPHSPVLLKEILEAFAPISLKMVVDGTVGAGGHAQALLEGHPEIEHYLALDQDPEALAVARDRLRHWHHKISFKCGNFAQFDRFLQEASLPLPNGILVDLGVSSMQLDRGERGFSFMQEAPLDMRMSPEIESNAADILNTWSEEELGRIFREYGEEKGWKVAARTVVKSRKIRPFLTTRDLVTVLTPILTRFYIKKKIHPLTLIFQALRICVNRELEMLELFLPKSMNLLSSGGRLAVISFHSLEDRIVKTHMRTAASDKWETTGIGGLFLDKDPSVRLITKKPIVPNLEEIQNNPRSRSAKLRIVEKI